jgi:hypothetical protein
LLGFRTGDSVASHPPTAPGTASSGHDGSTGAAATVPRDAQSAYAAVEEAAAADDARRPAVRLAVALQVRPSPT